MCPAPRPRPSHPGAGGSPGAHTMRKRQPTEEQRRAAAERRERFRELSRRVAEMPEGERAALVARVGAAVTCEGRALSPHNTLLLLAQRDGVSMVGGFR